MISASDIAFGNSSYHIGNTGWSLPPADAHDGCHLAASGIGRRRLTRRRLTYCHGREIFTPKSGGFNSVKIRNLSSKILVGNAGEARLNGHTRGAGIGVVNRMLVPGIVRCHPARNRKLSRPRDKLPAKALRMHDAAARFDNCTRDLS